MYCLLSISGKEYQIFAVSNSISLFYYSLSHTGNHGAGFAAGAAADAEAPAEPAAVTERPAGVAEVAGVAEAAGVVLGDDIETPRT